MKPGIQSPSAREQARRIAERCKPTKDDLRQRDITDKAVEAAIASLRHIAKENPHKLLVNLARHEMEAMTVAVITAADTRRRELEVLEELDDLNDDISDIGV